MATRRRKAYTPQDFGAGQPPPPIGHNQPPEPIEVELPHAVLAVFADDEGNWLSARYRIMYGGRGGGKSEGVARVFLQLARLEENRDPVTNECKGVGFLCTRMFQNSITDSVYRTLEDAAFAMGIHDEFEWQKTTVIHKRTRSWFIFKGLQRDINSIKSLKGVKWCWVEEAEPVPEHTWRVLRATLRIEDGGFVITFNPDDPDGATYNMFVKRPPPGAIVKLINWWDNPFFPKVLNDEREIDFHRAMHGENGEGDAAELAAYQWVWEGKPRRITDAVIFRRKVEVGQVFDDPPGVRPLYGADWGFSDDPATLLRCYIDEPSNTLFISHEMFAFRCDLNDLGAKWEELPDVRKWPIKGDNSRPETISHMRNEGFDVTAAEKWPGSVEDGVEFLKSFTRIVVHQRCPHTAREFRLYSYKVDPKQVDDRGHPVILPEIVDRHNHAIDAIRYSLDGRIGGRAAMRISKAALAKAMQRGTRR